MTLTTCPMCVDASCRHCDDAGRIPLDAALRLQAQIYDCGPKPERFADNRGSRNNAARLGADQVREIRALYAEGGHSQRALAAEYGVTTKAVFDIIHRNTWGHV